MCRTDTRQLERQVGVVLSWPGKLKLQSDAFAEIIAYKKGGVSFFLII